MEHAPPTVAFLQEHQRVYAAPLDCSSYGALGSAEAVELAVSALTAFGYTLEGSVAQLRDRRVISVWTDVLGHCTVALAEDLVARCCYLVVAGKDEGSIAELGAALAKLVPLVEIHEGFDPYGELTQGQSAAA